MSEKVNCPNCGGVGKVVTAYGEFKMPRQWDVCPFCKGSGYRTVDDKDGSVMK